MKNRLLSLLFILGGFSAYSQVGIGKLDPSRSAQLEVFANDKGILIPQVELNSSTDLRAITNGNVESLLIFNTKTIADVKPGYYYWYDNKWNRILISGEASAGTVVFNPVTNEFTYTDINGAVQVVNISTIIKGNETITTITNNGGGSYTYKNEAGDSVNIEVVGDVIANASSIFNTSDVTNIIQQISEKAEGSVTFNSTTNEFSYTDATGNVQLVDINEIVKTNETLTTLTNNGAGSYTYKNEKGDSVNIEVVGDVIANASSIFNTSDITNIIQQISEKAEGSVTYNSTTKEFSYTDASGVTQIVNISEIVKGNETITTLKNKGAGLYTYKNEEAEETNINVVEDVISNASTIFSNTDVLTELTKIIENKETLTSLVYDATASTLTYTDENAAPNTISLTDLVGGAETQTTLVYDKTAETLTYNGESGTPTVINLIDLVGQAETITTLVHNPTTKTLTLNAEAEQSSTINLKDITTTTPATVLEVTGAGATFADATVNIVPSTVVGDVLTTSEAGVVAWKAPAKANFLGIKVTSDDYTVTDEDYTIIANKLTKDITITLPSAATNKGRILVINQHNVIVANTPATDPEIAVLVKFNANVIYSDSATYPYIAASLYGGVTKGSAKITLQSDGENWYAITYTM